ncbi:hypothetical protein L6164_008479 [Bauhinia variegata]|uniref:Uncharacterized protein n=1 Tax=Bauhinia variegata TaxID=167791 RepID=A0ACB9PGX5_BAUVA|nr:hypothetical protein L6164_008479 [Bauhinia variegata]
MGLELSPVALLHGNKPIITPPVGMNLIVKIGEGLMAVAGIFPRGIRFRKAFPLHKMEYRHKALAWKCGIPNATLPTMAALLDMQLY